MTYTDSTSGTYVDYGQHYTDNTYRNYTNTITYPYQWNATSSDTFNWQDTQTQYLQAIIKKGWTKLIKPPTGKKIQITSINGITYPPIETQVKLEFIVPRNKILYWMTLYPHNYNITIAGLIITTGKTIFVKSEGDISLGITYKFID